MDILTAIESKIGECLWEVIIQQARYLFCFNSIVEDLEAEENNLKLKLADIKERVEREERNTKEMEKVVEKWLKDAGDVMADVQRLKDEIQLKESRLIGWCPDWGCRYSLGSKAADKTSFMSKLKNSADNFRTVAHLKRLPGIEFSAPRDFMSFKGTELASDQLIEALKNENTKLVGLYGAGGVGKTTLATAVGQELQQQQVFDEVVKATVSQNPNILDVQTKLAGQLGLELKEVTEEERAKRLYLRFTETKSKILVILDDVWEQHELKKEFGVPVDDNLNGCKILLTTRLKQICDGMVCNSSIPLGYLEPEEGLALLKYHAGIGDHDSTLIDVSKEVAGECKGLPLAIAAVGSALRGKDVDEWNLASHKLKTAKLDDVDGVDRKVYACLKLSYDYLKDDNTKLCFLLCSLFPEDFEIDLEELVRYGVGLGWYQGVETIEKARSLLRGMIKELKNSSLLLEADEEGFVKMHDVIHDVAMRIGSDDGKFFNGVGLTEWPEDEGLKQYKAISLLGIKKNVLPPNGWVYPNLHTLLLGNYERFFKDKFVVSDQFFEGLTALKVVTIRGGDLSIKSLQFLTDLQILHLIGCNVREMAFLRKLKRLQILCLEMISLDEISGDLADELSKLKLLDLNDFNFSEVRISLIKRFSQLQEFYGRMTGEVEGTNAECLSKDFAFPQLQRYKIFIGGEFSDGPHYSRTNTLSINNTEATSLVIFSALYQNVQYLCLKKVKGCQNILPNIDQRGLKELTVLELCECEDLECIMDVSQHVKSQSLVMLSRLAKLRLIDLRKLQWIWKAPAQHVDLQNLTEVEVTECNNLTYLFSLSQALSLLQLERLIVGKCEKLEHIIEAKIDATERRKNILEGDGYTIALPMLKGLELHSLPNLTTTFCLTGIADEFVQAKHLELRNLTEVKVEGCNSLTYLFSLSQARSLVQLKKLKVKECEKLEHIIEAKIDNNERRKNIVEGDEYTIPFPMLKKVALYCLPNLTTLSSECYFPTCQALQKLSLRSCPRLTCGVDEFVPAENLQYLYLENIQCCQNILSSIGRRGFNELTILKLKKCENIECIMDTSQHVGLQKTAALPKLRELTLDSLPNLITLINCPRLTSGTKEFVQYQVEAEHLELPNLIEVEVRDCNSLTYLFSLSQARSLVHLKELKVEECEKLEHIIEAKIVNNERRKNKFGGDEYAIALLMLKELTLDSLPNLTTLSSECYFPTCPALQNLSLINCPRLTGRDEFVQSENLQYLRVERCYHLYDAIVALLKHSLKNLQELCIGDLGAQVVFQLSDIIIDGQESKLFPSFKELSLYGLREMEVLYKGPTQFFCRLQNLTSLNVRDYNRLRHLLTPTLARNLLQLEYLSIHKCSELEQIIKEDEEEDHLPPVCFPSLKKIDVRLCPKLKHLFHISVAPSLQNLFFLRLEEVDELEELFWHKDGAVVMNYNTIVNFKFWHFYLKDLPNLTNCWPEGYDLIFPSLYLKRVENCPKLKNKIFSRGRCQ